MKKPLQKKIAVVCAVVFLILALIPAYYPADDEAVKKDCPFCRTFDLLFTGLSPVVDFDNTLSWSKAPSSDNAPCSATKGLPTLSETRAPPA